jgi:hypothetical protein
MVAGRLRFASAGDTLAAVILLTATLGVGLLIIHELTSIRSAPPPAQAPAAPAATPTSSPELSIAVSVLPLPDGQELRVGDPAEKVSRILAKAAEVGLPRVERGRMGDRVTRRYEFGPVGFTLVMEAFERNGVMRVAAIYIR